MMFKTSSMSWILAIALVPSVCAVYNCPLPGPIFPSSTSLSSSPLIQDSLSNLTSLIEAALSTSNTIYGPFDSTNTSFSLSISSVSEVLPLYTYNYTSPSLLASPFGTHSVDTSTIFRIGSVTKVLSVYTFLLSASGDSLFNMPITNYVPELASASAQTSNGAENPVDFVAWEDVMIGDLASQLSGIARDFSVVDLSQRAGVTNSIANSDGLPSLNSSEIPPCGISPLCTRAQFFAGITTQRHPVHAPGAFPSYSNIAFQILSYALENITGQSFQSSMEETIFKPLGLNNTFYALPPNNETAAIPEDFAFYYGFSVGDESPASSIYTTISDFSVIANSILTSSLLPPAVTNRWLKPHSFLSDPSNFVGAPWEISRMLLGSASSSPLDIYSKEGDFPGYSAMLALIPTFNLSFLVFLAGDNTGANAVVLSDIIADTLLPVVLEAMREKADEIYSGTYTFTYPDGELNSTMIISTDPTQPGLGVDRWISNGTDVFTAPDAEIWTGMPTASARLYPSGLEHINNETGVREVGFRAVFQTPNMPAAPGVFNDNCISWETSDYTYWGLVATDEILFTFDSRAIVASGISPRIEKVVLERVNGN